MIAPVEHKPYHWFYEMSRNPNFGQLQRGPRMLKNEPKRPYPDRPILTKAYYDEAGDVLEIRVRGTHVDNVRVEVRNASSVDLELPQYFWRDRALVQGQGYCACGGPAFDRLWKIWKAG